MDTPAEPGPSPALLQAALGGLLFATLPGCVFEGINAPACDTAGDTAEAAVTETKTDVDMTLEQFTAWCDALGGTLEQHAHCGGENTCRGISYDSRSDVLTEHTCQGTNTCEGYSCVVCGDGLTVPVQMPSRIPRSSQPRTSAGSVVRSSGE